MCFLHLREHPVMRQAKKGTQKRRDEVKQHKKTSELKSKSEREWMWGSGR